MTGQYLEDFAATISSMLVAKKGSAFNGSFSEKPVTIAPFIYPFFKFYTIKVVRQPSDAE